MSIVSSLTKADNHTQTNGLRWITHYFTDHLGVVHQLGPRLVDGSWAEPQYQSERDTMAVNLENTLAFQEQQAAMIRIIDGENALTVTNDFKYSTQKEIAKFLIRWMMEENDPKVVIALEPLLTYLNGSLTDLQIQNLLEITPAQLLKMREKAKQILNIPAPCQSAATGISLAGVASEVID